MNDLDTIIKNFKEAISLKKSILENELFHNQILSISEVLVKAFSENNKVMFCGNGGSAADAQHLAAELSGRYYLDRPALNAKALHTDTSYLTAVANDYSFEEIYSRLIHGVANTGDVMIGLSTSGNSKNIVNALKQARKQQLITIGLTGSEVGEMDQYCDLLIKVPSNDTPRVQECHILIGHTICELVEKYLFD
ncbi:MAG: D-sedoheptulose-7-phosphate isomerase [Flavobacteriales bacterium]